MNLHAAAVVRLCPAFVCSMIFLVCPARGEAQAVTSDIKEQIVGSWTLLSVVLEQGGAKTEVFGPNPKGMLTYDAKGNYAYVILRADLPKIASNNRMSPTPEESKAISTGVLAAYGKYSFNPDGTMTMRIDGGTFPNFDGAEQKRLIALNGDELRVTNPTPPAGGGTAYILWKRLR
ncbi:MAG: hypothetical protein H6R02_1114 [Burkholderiaceae bacterium]|jgi:hypothetical protein|nr:hypothetical protein [Burkholderiaceae bacterium]